MRSMHHLHHHGRRFARGLFRRDEERPDDGHGRSRFGRGGPRAGRMFDHGELRYVLLALVAEKPRHGYEIIKAIEDRTAGTYSPSPGVIYPTLTMLEELGQATVAESEGKKLYAITPDGAAFLEANAATVESAMARMRSVNAAHGGGPAPAIIRATEGLKLALRLRLARGPLTEEQVQAIAAALDTAVGAIERS